MRSPREPHPRPPVVPQAGGPEGFTSPIGHVARSIDQSNLGCPRQLLVRRNVNETEPMRPVYPQTCKDDGKLWPEYGAGWFCPICPVRVTPRNPHERAGVELHGGPHRFTQAPSGRSPGRQKTVTDMVDIEQSYGLYTTPHWRAAAWRDGAPAKLLTDSGDRSPTTQVGGAGFGGSPVSGEGGSYTSGLFDR
jgi:hypothetical protein